MWVGEPPTVSQGFRAPGQEGQRGFHSDALNHSQLLRFLKGPPWCGPKRRPRRGNLCRGGVAGRGPSPGVLRNALQRDARGMQRLHGTGTKPRSSGARFLTTGKLLGEGRLGCLGVPQGALAEFSLQRPGYFGTLERAKFQMYHTERSCFRRQGWPVTHQAMSFLTKQRQPRPGTPPGVGALSSVREGPFTGRGLWIRAT